MSEAFEVPSPHEKHLEHTTEHAHGREAEKLEATSREWDQKSEEALHQHHRWAQAMTAIQIAISLTAIILLTRKEWLKRMSYTAGAVAGVLGSLAWLHL
ncbi:MULTISPECIES: DUF4337 family protein [Pseudomonas fluorescens group]|uniref:DUF4337 domain-containing protein n=1 Tax=Pseudomonas fluorescens TaxID=294 RepID=A0A0D0RVI6_PSEFL|nr:MULTISPECIES: DUF4337 family protein [Pseudomonas fluorescens group]AZE62655.1 Putative transmembrane protein [Pseudomonas synxantha]KIR23577.1 hypothetical protein PFLU3_09280 [Pseudomonas fluorescens]